MNHWLVKQEPSSYSFSDLQQEGRTGWTGVRNYQARNNLQSMKKGDKVFFYHSGDEKAVVGTAKVSKPAFQDPTSEDASWIAVELIAGKPQKDAVTLAEIKAHAKLAGTALLKQSLLSVVLMTLDELADILAISKT